MNTIKVPEPIMREEYTRNGGGSHVTLGAPARGDHFNLNTGEVTVARVIGGVRYDTVRATLTREPVKAKGLSRDSQSRHRCTKSVFIHIIQLSAAIFDIVPSRVLIDDPPKEYPRVLQKQFDGSSFGQFFAVM